MRKWLFGLCAVVALGLTCPAEEPVQGEAAATQVKTVQEIKADLKTQIKKLRGKVLYKKSQISKLERQAKEKDAMVKAKAEQLEAQRRELFFAANPTLKQLYSEMEEFQTQIERLVQQNASISVEAERN